MRKSRRRLKEEPERISAAWESRNLMNWRVPNETPSSRTNTPRSATTPTPRQRAEEEQPVDSPKPPKSPARPRKVTSKAASPAKSLKKGKSVQPSSSNGSGGSVDRERLKERIWAYLMENLNRAVDELYYTCEYDSNLMLCNEVLKVLNTCVEDFKKLSESLQVQSEFEQKTQASPAHVRPSQSPNNNNTSSATTIPTSAPSSVVVRATQSQPSSQGLDPAQGQCVLSYKDALKGAQKGVKIVTEGKSPAVAWEVKKEPPKVTPSVPMLLLSPDAVAAAPHAKRNLVNDFATSPRATSPTSETSFQQQPPLPVATGNQSLPASRTVTPPSEETEVLVGSAKQTNEDSSDLNESLMSGLRGLARSVSISSIEGDDRDYVSIGRSSSSIDISKLVLDRSLFGSTSASAVDPVLGFLFGDSATDKKLSWADMSEEISPGDRGRMLHEFLSSPERRRKSPEDYRRHAERKQAKAEQNRSRIESEKQDRLKEKEKKLKDVNERQQQKMEESKLGVIQKLERADQLHGQHLQTISKKAINENTKVSEVAFIQNLSSENKKMSIQKKLEDGEARRLERLEEMKKKKSEEAAREEAVLERKRLMDQERLSKLQEKEEQRKEQEQRLLNERRQRIAMQEARLESQQKRVEMINKTFQAEAEERGLKLSKKLEESAARKSQHIEQIREKAAAKSEKVKEVTERKKETLQTEQKARENSRGPKETPPSADSSVSSTLCITEEELKEFREARKAARRKSKKIKQKLAAAAEEYLKSIGLPTTAIGVGEVPEIATTAQDQPSTPARGRAGRKTPPMTPPIDQPTIPKSESIGEIPPNLDSVSSASLSGEDGTAVSQVSPPKRKVSGAEQQLPEPVVASSSGGNPRIVRILSEANVALQSKKAEPLKSAIQDLLRRLETRKESDLQCIRANGGLELLTTVCTQQMAGVSSVLIKMAAQALAQSLSLHENLVYFVRSLKVLPLIHTLTSCILKDEPYVPLLMHILCVCVANGFDSPELKEDFMSYFVSYGLIDELSLRLSRIRTNSLDPATALPLALQRCVSFLDVCTLFPEAKLREKPVFESTQVGKAIVGAFKETHFVGIFSLLASVLTQCSALRPASSQGVPSMLSNTVLNTALTCIRVLNNVALLDLPFLQTAMGNDFQLEAHHSLSFLLTYCCGHVDQDISTASSATSLVTFGGSASLHDPPTGPSQPAKWSGSDKGDNCRDLLHEILLLLGYFALQNERNQEALQWGKSPTMLQKLCALPIQYFTIPKFKHILLPTLIATCHENPRNKDILQQELSCDLLISYLAEHRTQLQSLSQETPASSLSAGSVPRFSLANRFPPSLWEPAESFLAATTQPNTPVATGAALTGQVAETQGKSDTNTLVVQDV